jgi:hypothetical protein
VEGHDVVRITSEEVVMQNPTPHTSPPRTSLCSASVKNLIVVERLMLSVGCGCQWVDGRRHEVQQFLSGPRLAPHQRTTRQTTQASDISCHIRSLVCLISSDQSLIE